MKLYPIPAVMEETGLGRTTIFGLISSGELRSVKVGRRRLVPAAALDEYIANLTGDNTHEVA
ncbi:helix-turn-helix domain-containing protein [Corynebacterium freneyi]|uniref:helix-turn-helix transcriptional regulator n=1 Tax=Corynebacterium freneyi TaxID=134034 RepID=UPI00254D047C|nr:helix-turn-helix domain-containing protein [Corynebacterium freneyi]MDK8768214.1 helix-turn-helix domain-containing protein [Corynebacterium freneyi]